MTPERVLQAFQVLSIACVGIAAVAAVPIYYLSQRVNAAKDRELEAHRTESSEKIAAAESRAAEANAVALQAQLELAKFTEPRSIAPEDQEKMIATLKQFEGQHFGFAAFGDPESLALVRSLDTRC